MSKIQKGYKGIDVEVLGYTKHPAKILWDVLKQTWIELQDIEYDPELPIVKDFIDGCLTFRLNPTPQRLVMMHVVFKNISRVNLAQLTRNKFSFNAESQMPQHVKHNVILPLNIANSEFAERAQKLIEDSQKLYDDMTKTNDEGPSGTIIPYQDARYLLMHGQTANIAASFNIMDLVSVAAQRLDNNTADEINYSFRMLIKRLREAIEADDELDELDKKIYLTKINACDAMGANQEKAIMADDVFGNSFKRFPDGSKAVTEATEKCKADYTKSAWYDELKRIYDEEPELLLKGEKEMIETWKED